MTPILGTPLTNIVCQGLPRVTEAFFSRQCSAGRLDCLPASDRRYRLHTIRR